MFFGFALLVEGWGFVGWGKKSSLGPAEISSFFSRDLTGHNKHDSFWVVALTGYFYILLLWPIVVSDCLPLEIHKHLALPFLVLFLQPTGKQITISINIFTDFCCCSNSLHRKPTIWKLMNYMLCTHGVTCNLRK